VGIALRVGREQQATAGARPAGSRRPWWVWFVPFAALFTVLIARNTYLFSTALYEQGDSGANSILIQQALRFQLLVGHYSREKFNHPGPAYLYVQAFGQWVSRDLLHVVPTAWNGQFLAVYALDSAMAALALGIVYGLTRSLASAAAAFAAVLGFAAGQPGVVTSNWMPFLLVLTFLVFLLATASVASGQSRDLWVLSLSGCLLVHGYAPNLLFVPLLVIAAAVVVLWPQRRHPLRAAGRFFRDRPRQWVPAAVIAGLFALPVVINTILHWPGEFGKYISYGTSHKAGGHSAAQVADYVLYFWWPRQGPWVETGAAVLLAAGAVAVALLSSGPLRRAVLALVAFDALATVFFAYYAATGIDGLAYYIGYFYWGVPVSLAVIIAAGALRAVPALVAVPAAVAALVVFGILAPLHSDLHDNSPGLPGAVSTLAARSHGRPIDIIGTGHAWVEIPGFLVQAERTGVTACVVQPGMAYLVTQQSICTRAELRSGVTYLFNTAPPPRKTEVLIRFGNQSEGYADVTRWR
jgi:hypothetical protein